MTFRERILDLFILKLTLYVAENYMCWAPESIKSYCFNKKSGIDYRELFPQESIQQFAVNYFLYINLLTYNDLLQMKGFVVWFFINYPETLLHWLQSVHILLYLVRHSAPFSAIMVSNWARHFPIIPSFHSARPCWLFFLFWACFSEETQCREEYSDKSNL